MNPDHIDRFLTELDLAEYLSVFEENAIDGETLLELTDGDLKEIGVAKLGHRKKLLGAIATLSGEADVNAGVIPVRAPG